jgi:uncharacterized protein YgiB involved in biofilm formation
VKRSLEIALTVMASTAGLAGLNALLEAVGRKAQVSVYSTVDACIADDKHSEGYCKAQFAEAQAVHAASAPRCAAKDACDATFGINACEYRPGSAQADAGPSELRFNIEPYAPGTGSEFWTPIPAGYLVSDGGDASERDGRRERRHYRGQPVYIQSGTLSGDGSYYTAAGFELRAAPASFTVPVRAVETAPPPAKIQSGTCVIHRGGFGRFSLGSGGS